jgi:hypothetical protein
MGGEIGHRHRQAACPRAGRGRAAVQLQISGDRRRHDPPSSCSSIPGAFSDCRGRGLGLSFSSDAPQAVQGQRETDGDELRQRQQEHALLLVLRQKPARGPQADRGADRVHLRRMRRAVHGHHPRRDQDHGSEVFGWRADPARNLQGAGRLRDRPDACQARAVGRGPQPLQAAEPFLQAGHRAVEVEHPADRPHRHRQDAAGPDPGAHPGRALHHGRCDHADRSRLCRRGRGKHHPQAVAGVGIQRRTGAARHRLHRRGRQDHPQVRQPLDHPRCQRAKACSRRF